MPSVGLVIITLVASLSLILSAMPSPSVVVKVRRPPSILQSK